MIIIVAALRVGWGALQPEPIFTNMSGGITATNRGATWQHNGE